MSLGRANRIVISSLFFLEKINQMLFSRTLAELKLTLKDRRMSMTSSILSFFELSSVFFIFHFFFRSSQFHSVISLFLFIFHNSNKINTTHYFFESFSASLACVVVAFFSHKLHARSLTAKKILFFTSPCYSRELDPHDEGWSAAITTRKYPRIWKRSHTKETASETRKKKKNIKIWKLFYNFTHLLSISFIPSNMSEKNKNLYFFSHLQQRAQFCLQRERSRRLNESETVDAGLCKSEYV